MTRWIFALPKLGACEQLPSRLVAGLLLTVVLLSKPAPALAQTQLTTKALIGDAVADVGPKYSDIDAAITRFNNRDTLGARALLEEARKKDPTLPPTDLLLAKMYFLTGNAAAGRAALEKTAAEFSGDPEVYLILGDQDFSQGGTVEAEALYEKALPLIEKFNENPKRKRNFGIRARWGRAAVAERRKNWAAMGRDLQELLKIDEHHASARYKMGIALCMLNRFPEGRTAFEAAKKDDNALPSAALAVALMYDRLGRTEDARKAYIEAFNQDKTDLNAMISYGQFLIKVGSLDEAEKMLALARNTHPDSLDALILGGVAARMNGKAKEAEQLFVTALGKFPAHSIVINQLALLLIQQEEDSSRSRALQFAVINSKLNEQSADAHVTAAWVNFKLNRLADFNNSLRTGLQLGGLNQDSSYLVAEMLSAQNTQEQKENARRLLTEALGAESGGIFIHRKEAQDLLKKLGGA
jgi:Tfp pilus assembly protein PilF